MAIFVDEPINYGVRYGKAGPIWSHLFTDGTKEELHAFAARIGLQRRWFQDKSLPHYDVTPYIRAKAVSLGAIEVKGREKLMELVRQRAAEVREREQGA